MGESERELERDSVRGRQREGGREREEVRESERGREAERGRQASRAREGGRQREAEKGREGLYNDTDRSKRHIYSALQPSLRFGGKPL